MIQAQAAGGRAEVPASPVPRLKVDAVSKTFGRNRVLRDVSLRVDAGEIHALIGQNGSGKSTLAKLLTGLYSPDPGAQIEIDGTPLRLPVRPTEARARGVAVVHQSLGLVAEMSVLENMRVGRLHAGRFSRRIRWAAEREAASEVFERLERHVSLDTRVGALSEEERATVAIARALQDAAPGSGLIIFDESTRALSRRSLEHFYEMLGDIVAGGTSALVITHRLEEVIDAADRVSVLRDGALVEAGRKVIGLDESELAAMMLGRVLGQVSTGGGGSPRHDLPPAASLREISVSALDGVSLDIAPGEIVGVTGLADSGYDELPYLLAGAARAGTGRLEIGQRQIDLHRFDPAAAISAGVALVPADRERDGLAHDMTVLENASVPGTSARNTSFKPIARNDELAAMAPWLTRLELRPPDPRTVVGKLSGGNQQKVVLAKWLARTPTLLALHEPTQAVDVGAREIIVNAVKEAAAGGCAVLVAGGDENELSMLCDRILILADGRVVREMPGPCAPDDIVEAIFAGTERRPLRRRGPAPAPPASKTDETTKSDPKKEGQTS